MNEIKLNLDKMKYITKTLKREIGWCAMIHYDRSNDTKVVHKVVYNRSQDCLDFEGVNIFQTRIIKYLEFKYELKDLEYYIKVVNIESGDNVKYKIINNSKPFRSILLANFTNKTVDISTDDEISEFKEFLKLSGFFYQNEVEFCPFWYHTIFKSEKGTETLYPWEIRRTLETRDYKVVENILKYLSLNS